MDSSVDVTEENVYDYSFIDSLTAREVSEEEMLDFRTTFFKAVLECEKTGRPIVLRTKPENDFTSPDIKTLLSYDVDNPYQQQVKKIRKHIYSFERGKKSKGKKNQKPSGTSSGKTSFQTIKDNGELPSELKDLSFEELEREYWRQIRVIGGTKDLKHLATYASDVSGSYMNFASKQFALSNLKTLLQKVVAKYAKPVDGITVPMLYIGTWLSTFTQHLEDKNLWSVSYLHAGAPKTWYITPAEYTNEFEEKVYKDLANFPHDNCPAPFRHKSILVDILWYKENNIPLIRVVQEPGDFVILPPYCYHFGWNHSWNTAEAVNFATKDWIVQGLLAIDCDRAYDHETVQMEPFVHEYMPEKYREYLSGNLEVVHPHDPEKRTIKVKPQPLKVSAETETVLCKAAGLQCILMAKIDHYTEYVYAVFGDGLKTWIPLGELDGVHWNATGEPVLLPKEVFYSPSITNPYFYIFPVIQVSSQLTQTEMGVYSEKQSQAGSGYFRCHNLGMQTENSTFTIGLQTDNPAFDIGIQTENPTCCIQIQTENLTSTIEIQTENQTYDIQVQTENSITNIETRADIKTSNIEIQTENFTIHSDVNGQGVAGNLQSSSNNGHADTEGSSCGESMLSANFNETSDNSTLTKTDDSVSMTSAKVSKKATQPMMTTSGSKFLYQCSKCLVKKLYASKYTFDRHVSLCGQKDEHACQLCHFKNKRQDKLNEHIRLKHKDIHVNKPKRRKMN